MKSILSLTLTAGLLVTTALASDDKKHETGKMGDTHGEGGKKPH